MATATQNQLDADEEEVGGSTNPTMESIKVWMREKGPWMATSLTAHAVILLSTWLILELLGVGIIDHKKNNGPEFEAAADAVPEKELERFDYTNASYEPTDLTTESLTAKDTEAEIKEKYIDDNETFVDSGGGVKAPAALNMGGLGGFTVAGIGPGGAVNGPGGVGGSDGFGTSGGSGGDSSGFGGRGQGHRAAMVGQYGGTPNTERAVAAALNWLYRHQSPDGSWSLGGFTKQCKGGVCGGAGNHTSDAAATAMGLLPFLAAGQTHLSKGPYTNTVNKGVMWLISHQKPNGDLSDKAGGNSMMYTHGIATICLCECYGLSDDSRVRQAALKAIQFIEACQDKNGGGWRYTPNEAGDTSVVGWQVMALKSAMMAGLPVKPDTMEGAKKYFQSFKGKSPYGGLYGYLPGSGPTTTMTAVGGLCSQYMGANRGDPSTSESVKYIMGNMPNKGERNIYYWYYATQVMHNMLGPDWDTWNRAMRKVLIDQQSKEGCASGSWDPDRPTKDHWGEAGGRVMMTSLCCLTLEVYYRYLPLYKLDKPGEMDAKAAAAEVKQDAK